MDFTDPQTLTMAYLISNVVGVLLLGIAFKAPKLARFLFFLLFAWASWVNYTTCHSRPEVYLMYAERATHWYALFINGWFGDHITGFVSFIAFGQALIAVGMLLKGAWVYLACIGAIIFLLAIAPLGLYAAFPFSLTVSAAAYFIIRKDDKNYLWKLRS